MAELDIVMPDGLKAVSVLGKGAMGTVYKAWQEKLKRYVAVKTCSIVESEDAGQDLGRLEDEALTIAQLNHPNIVSLIDVVRDDTAVYLIMEHLDGPPLSRLLNAKVPLDELGEYRTMIDTRNGRTVREDWMLEIGLSVAKALSYAHSRKVLHRDIKPANIIITEAMNVKLLDFSIARNSGSQQEGRTLAGTVFGTVQYMSPEQILSHPMDGRTDIYSLGCTLFHLATGETVFNDPNDITVCMNHVNMAPRQVKAMNPYLTAETCDLIMKCLEKNPKDRFLTADELIESLKRILRNIGSGMRFQAISVDEVNRLSLTPPPAASASQPAAASVRSSLPSVEQLLGMAEELNQLETVEESPDTGIVQYPVGPGVPISEERLTPLPKNPSTSAQPVEPGQSDSTSKPKIKPASAQSGSAVSVVRTTKPDRAKKKVGLEELASRSDEYESFTGREAPSTPRDTNASSSQVPGITSNAYVPVSYSSQLIDHDTALENKRLSKRKTTTRFVIVIAVVVLAIILYLLFG